MIRRLLIATSLALLSGNAAVAQEMPSTSSPGMLSTSPLGTQGTLSVGPAGIPLGATELGTMGVSPMPFSAPLSGSTTGTPSPCSAAGASTPGLSGVPSSVGTFDGGSIPAMSSTVVMGITPGMAPCGGTSTGGGCVTSLPSTTSPGGATRTGVPLGTTEIGNAGTSGVTAVPTPSPTPSNILPGSSTCPSNKGEFPAPPGFPSIC
jgi:hypothetical protein